MAFVSSPIGEKPVTAVPGIGDAVAHRFAVKGITKASELLGIYLLDPSNFQTRLGEEFGVYSHHARFVYNALYCYCFNMALLNIPLGERPLTAVPGIGYQAALRFTAMFLVVLRAVYLQALRFTAMFLMVLRAVYLQLCDINNRKVSPQNPLNFQAQLRDFNNREVNSDF